MKKKDMKDFPNFIDLPEKYGNLIDDLMDIDRAYFEKHPEQDFYIRFYVQGEMYPFFHDCIFMKVINYEPGVRARIPVLKNQNQ